MVKINFLVPEIWLMSAKIWYNCVMHLRVCLLFYYRLSTSETLWAFFFKSKMKEEKFLTLIEENAYALLHYAFEDEYFCICTSIVQHTGNKPAANDIESLLHLRNASRSCDFCILCEH